jgi:hypothetical protein
MSECKLCDKEKSIVSVTGMQIPIGERCYTKMITKDVIWDSETKLKKIEEMLNIG